MPIRKILHVDMDAFFASVEVLKNPKLKDKPIIVGGDPKKRGVVATCSYQARQFGVHSAMPSVKAKKLCPQAIFLTPDFTSYKKYSKQVMRILSAFSPYIEVVSIDEAYLDVTDINSSAIDIAKTIKTAIYQKTCLSASIGVATNKLIAKICSSLAKPSGIKVVFPGQEIDFLAPLPIQKIPGIGKKTTKNLNNDGIKTVLDLQNLGLDTLLERYGSLGYFLYLAAFGKDKRAVEYEEESPKSLSAEHTFDTDLSDTQKLLQAFSLLLDKVYNRLIKHRMYARRVTIKLRYFDFKTITRSHTFPDHLRDKEVFKNTLYTLFSKHYSQKPIRLIGLSLEKLTDGYWQPKFI